MRPAPLAQHETQIQAGFAQTVLIGPSTGSAISSSEPRHRYALRQARHNFCSDGRIGLRHAMFATVLFVQNLEITVEDLEYARCQ